MTPSQRANILNHLAQINHPGITGSLLRDFVAGAQRKSNEEIIDCVLSLQDQIKSNRPALTRVLGNQFEFISRFKIPQPC